MDKTRAGKETVTIFLQHALPLPAKTTASGGTF